MIRDARVLRAGFVPREVEHRDAAVDHLSTVLDPLTDDEPAETAFVTGPSGAGKTCIAKFVTERLREEALEIEATYVNCWHHHTRYRMLYQILDDLGEAVDIHRQSTPRDELVDRLQRYDGSRRVVILDEVDQLDDPGVIYHVHTFPQYALILIANREEDLFGRVEDRLMSRLQSSEHVRLDGYQHAQLLDILQARVNWGLEPDVISADQLERIADAAAGDARLAIGILRSAASQAKRRQLDRITEEVLLDAATEARTELHDKNIDSLNNHQRVVYEIVRDHGPLGPSEIHERYEAEVDDPRTIRTIRSYLSKMARYNVLDVAGMSHDREYTVPAGTPSPPTP